MYILVFLASLGSVFGWMALTKIMAFSSLLYSFGIIAILVLGLIAFF